MTSKDTLTPKHHMMMLNVGQGDAFVCHLASGEVIVVDCNRLHRGEEPPTVKVLEKIFEQRESKDIDVLCLTHPHLDHFSGINEVIKWCENKGGTIKKLVLPSLPDIRDINRTFGEAAKYYVAKPNRTLQQYFDMLDAIDDLKSKIAPEDYYHGDGKQNVLTGTDLNGNSYSVDIIGPLAGTVDKNIKSALIRLVRNARNGVSRDQDERGDEVNESSCLLSILCNNCSILFAGDSSIRIIRDAWNGHIRNSAHKTIEVIKMPHHGSRGKRSEWGENKKMWSQILEAKAVALLSFGYNNLYKHPHEELLENLQSLDVSAVSTNYCRLCSSQPRQRDDVIERTFSDGDILPDSDAKVIELTIDDDGTVVPSQCDWERKCEFCNSITFLS